MTSVKSLCQLIWDLEDRYELLDWDIAGVKVWQYLRMQLYFLIAQRSRLLTQPHSLRDRHTDKVRALPSLLKSTLLRNPYLANRIVDSVVVEHDRHKELNGQLVDIYTHHLQDELREAGDRLMVLERPYLLRHFKSGGADRYHLDILMMMAAVAKRMSSVTLKRSHRTIADELQQEILRHSGAHIDLSSLFSRGIRQFKANHRLFTWLLRKCQPRRLFLVVSYGQGDLTQAAKDMGIETIEVQHGAFSKYHLGYSYPGRVSPLDYFPDTFYAWSQFWASHIPLPLPRERIIEYGFPWMEHLKSKYSNVTRRKDQVLVLSQGAIGEKMARAILNRIHCLSDFQIVYKLHPGEYDRWEQYPSLMELSHHPNVQIATDEDLYSLFAASSYQIGVYSTAIYEGMEFGCRTLLLDLPGVEYMDHLRGSGEICMLDDFLSRKGQSEITETSPRFSHSPVHAWDT